MAYVALKPCSFAGQSFRIGEIVPDELIHPGAVKNLLTMKVIAITEDVECSTEGCSAPVIIPDVRMTILAQTEKGNVELEPTDEGIQDVFTVLIGKPAAAEAIINDMDDADALLLLHMSDSRKAVKALAEARIKALSEGEQ